MANFSRLTILSAVVIFNACNARESSPPCKGPCPTTRPGAKTSRGAIDTSPAPRQVASTTLGAQQGTHQVAKSVAPAAKKTEVEWLGTTTIEIRKSDVVVYGYNVSIVYTLNLVEDDHGAPSGAELAIKYPDNQVCGITIVDRNHDDQAEGIDGCDRSGTVFYYYRHKEVRQIFIKADALLKRFRRELEVDDLVKTGPPSEWPPLFDPFPVKSGNQRPNH